MHTGASAPALAARAGSGKSRSVASADAAMVVGGTHLLAAVAIIKAWGDTASTAAGEITTAELGNATESRWADSTHGVRASLILQCIGARLPALREHLIL